MKLCRLLFSGILVVLFFQLAGAGQTGGMAGSHLRMGLGARSLALGNAATADRANGYSFYYNPSSSALLEKRIFSLSYSFLSLDRRFNFIGFTMPVPPEAGFSLGWINTGVSDITAYNSLGEAAGSIEHSANGAFFNFSKRFGQKISLGLSIKYLWENINDGTDQFDYSSSGWGWDFGVTYLLLEDVTVAGAIRDVGSKLKANTSNIFQFGGTTIDRFPQLYNLGLYYVTPYPWLRLAYDFGWTSVKTHTHHVGLEAVYASGSNVSKADNLALRLGLNGKDFVAGVGMDFTLLGYTSHLDYAFVPSIIDEGSSHVFSWQFLFK
jgi:hypothetical protein